MKNSQKKIRGKTKPKIQKVDVWDEKGNVLPPDYKLYEVVWFMGGLKAIWLERSARSFHLHNEMVGVGHTDCEIVGNIFENPELLNK